MADSPNTLSRQLRHAARLPEPDSPSDGELLGRFANQQDEHAFAELVRRHGPMVLGVCRRITGNSHDADDAFQATFLVLARKAGRLAEQSALGAWLYGVAHKAALKARAVALRRRAKETTAARPEGTEAMADSSDVLAVIEQELARLPKKYREPLVLCALCGRPRKEVADQLGVAEGTLASRIATARERLAEQLRRRGVVVPAVAMMTDDAPATAAVPTSLFDSTLKAATGTVPAAVARIASEVTRAMFLNKLRTSVLILVAVAMASAAGLATLSRSSANPPAPIPTTPLVPVANRTADKPDTVKVKELTEKWDSAKKDLQGVWELQKQIIDDKELEFQFEYFRQTFSDRTVRIEYKTKDGSIEHDSELSYTVNPTTTPPEMTTYGKNMLVMGLYDLNGDTLRVAFHGISELERPRGFAVADKRVTDMPLIVWEFKRKK
ncbi:MAG: sigma-70 family RNA polymerase sigma factor [Planctomycetia bacterium]|nr:sigma-70 family RNA polymerase sigma factor [Planctomycetia bacterium]